MVATGSNSGTLLSLDHLIAVFRRQWRLVAACTAAGALLGLVVALTSTKLYTASASLIIDPPGIGSQEGAVASSDRGLDTGAVDSEVEVLRSDRIAIAVAGALDLENDPLFMDRPVSLASRLRGLLSRGGADDLTPEEKKRLLLADIVAELDGNVWIARVGESYVLEVNYTSRYPDLSARIANAYTEAYLQDQIGARVEAARHAGDWLATQLADVKQRAFDADLAAQRFRAEIPAASGAEDPGAASAQRVVRLRELERDAETYRALYQSLVGRYQDSLQQQSFPVASGRVISPATPPLRPSLPRKSLVLALAIVAGAGSGVAAAALRELRDRSFRTGAQMRAEIGLPYLGALPRLADRTPAPAQAPAGALVVPAALRQSIDAPLAPYADTLRRALAAIDVWRGDRTPSVIGFVSALPGEGRTTVAANLALLAAASGLRTLLVDGDLRSAGLTHALAPDATAGLAGSVAESAADPARLADACRRDPETGLAFLAAGSAAMPAADRVLGVGAIDALRARAGAFDLVLVDLPPAGPFSDARAAARALDGVVLVVRWGTTPRALVADLLSAEGDLARKIVGSLLNEVDADRVPLYAGRESTDFYRAKA